jgi:NTE family protein
MQQISRLSNTTVVLGGGGVWGIAWMAGVIKGLAERGVDINQAEAFIGTSAGSVVSAQLTGGMSVDELYRRQAEPASQAPEPLPASNESLAALMELMQRPWEDFDEKGRQLGALALRSKTMDPALRKAGIARRLGLSNFDWPDRYLSITAVDAQSGKLCVFNRTSGVGLVDAVAASCAVPGVWPPTLIGDRSYIDGGVGRSPDNAHLALGARSIIVLSPMGRSEAVGSDNKPSAISQDLAEFSQGGANVALIEPDAASLAAQAPHPLDPATRRPAAIAGRNQGLREIEKVERVF